MFSPSDTIVALATAPAPAGIGVVRLSGPQAAAIARTMLTLGHDLAPRHATLTRVVAREVPAALTPRTPRAQGNPRGEDNSGSNSLDDGSRADSRTDSGGGAVPVGRPIDEVVVTFFPGPHSYTAEDVVEISAHGSLELLREILAVAIAAGARLAEPGEFTLRAFLNGRVDLVQAEAVGDLVSAVTPLQARVAFDQLEGTLTRAIGALDAQLFDLVAKLEASVDFPDEGYHFVKAGEAEAALVRVRDGIESLLATSARGRLIREGRHIAILGRPNVGKSSLFNALVGTDRAIVTAIPGTTRDVLRETIDFEGVRLGLVDTAGIRHTEDEIEREGVARARGAGGVADLVLLVLDRSRPLEDEDRALLQGAAGTPPRVVVVNKSDLPAAWGLGDVFGGPDPTGLGPQRGDWAGPSPVEVSLKTGDGMAALRAAMRQALGMAPAGGSGAPAPEPLREAPIVSNVRHTALLEDARASLDRAISNLRAAGEQASEELVIADLAEVRRAFEDVTGRRTSEDLLRHIFANFCIGK